MYVKPEVQRFGNLRDLTLAGISGDADLGGYGIGCMFGPFDLGCPDDRS